ncbi:MAG: FAD binding domain-containing protein, partial [Candidatus Marinimicrobia bacterium]|nr:FAD binding domain-containing protein [Candidatus Neomarinimicrobiota bacterium]
MITFYLNQQLFSTQRSLGDTTLDLIRSDAGLTATKIGCREGDCGACIILWGRLQNGQLKYQSINSCLLPIGELQGTHVVTLEGLNSDKLTPVQDALLEHRASQCGFCTPGIVNSLTGFFLTENEISIESLTRALDGNLCRCTGYGSIKRAIHYLYEEYKDHSLPEKNRINVLVKWGFLPDYFSDMRDKLATISQLESNHSTEGQIVAGATDLLVQNFAGIDLEKIRFENVISDEVTIEIQGEYCYISGNATVNDLMKSDLLFRLLPEIQHSFSLISATAIRNRATLAGNIVNASPIGDLSVFFLPLQAELGLSINGNEQIVQLSNFFLS